VSFFQFKAPGRPTQVTASTHENQIELVWQPPRHGGLPIIYHVTPSPACPTCRGLSTPSTSGAPYTTISGLTPRPDLHIQSQSTDAAGAGPTSAPSNPVTP
jgi:hypothetical protein